MRTAVAGVLYFALVFVAGAVLGIARRLAVEAGLEATAAVLIELPVMLAISWWACRWLLSRLVLPGDMTSRLVMGGLAFVLLMAAELALTLFALGGTVASHLAAYRAPAALAGQLAFALMPLAARRSSQTAP
jgi:hypothetical protein